MKNIICLVGNKSYSDSPKALKLVNRISYKCLHKKIAIDPTLAECTCRDCGERLNPIEVLRRMANEESQLMQRIMHLEGLEKKIERKIKTKCQHCGRMTKINA